MQTRQRELQRTSCNGRRATDNRRRAACNMRMHPQAGTRAAAQRRHARTRTDRQRHSARLISRLCAAHAKPRGPHGVAWHGMAHGPLRGRCSRARTAAARSCPSTFPLSASNGPISHLVPVPDPAYLRNAMPLLHPQRWLGPTSARRPRQDGTVCSCCIAHAAAGWRTAMRPLDLRTLPAATARL